MSENHRPRSPKSRDLSLDFLRGTAVIFMIITHVNGTFYGGENPVFSFFTWWGATVCFTIFLFVSGAVYGRKIASERFDKGAVIRRSIELLLVYYFVVFLTLFLDRRISGLTDVADVLILKEIPVFTEFLLPFVFYGLVLAAGSGIVRRILKHPILLILTSVFVYLISLWLHDLNWGTGYINVIKGLLVGHSGWHRFGLLSYLPVYSAGLAVASIVQCDKTKKLIVSITVALVLFGIFWLLRLTGTSGWYRWPPSVLFLLYGMIYNFVGLALYELIRKVRVPFSVVSYIGRRGLGFFVWHLIVLLPLSHIIGHKRIGSLETFAVLEVVFGMCLVSVFLVEKLTRRYSKKAQNAV